MKNTFFITALLACLLIAGTARAGGREDASRLWTEGWNLDNASRFREAKEKYEQALKIFRKLGEKKSIGAMLSNIGIIYYDQGDYAKALELYQQALAIKKEIGDKKGIGNNLTNIGLIYSVQGDYTKALELYQQALAIHKELGDKKGEGGRGKGPTSPTSGTFIITRGTTPKPWNYTNKPWRFTKRSEYLSPWRKAISVMPI